MVEDRKEIAVVGAGIAGLTCAFSLSKNHKVDIFESCKRDGKARPLQMEGAVHYLKNIPHLKPTYKLTRLIFASENNSSYFEGNIGYLYKVGGTDGVDAKFRKEVEKKITIHHSKKITDLEQLSDYDLIVAADGYRSKIALMADMRVEKPENVGIGLGLTVEGEFECGFAYLLFDNYYAPGGYLYLMPISGNEASLVTASIGLDLNVKILRKRLREFADEKDLKIINEWADIEKWYRFNSYHKDNIYVIGSAASFTDKTYGFGLKYSIESARMCAEAIHTDKNYIKLLSPILRELRFWEKVGNVLLYTTNKEKDTFVNFSKNPIVRRRIENGKSCIPCFNLLRAYYRFSGWASKGFHPHKSPVPSSN